MAPTPGGLHTQIMMQPLTIGLHTSSVATDGVRDTARANNNCKGESLKVWLVDKLTTSTETSSHDVKAMYRLTPSSSYKKKASSPSRACTFRDLHPHHPALLTLVSTGTSQTTVLFLLSTGARKLVVHVSSSLLSTAGVKKFIIATLSHVYVPSAKVQSSSCAW